MHSWDTSFAQVKNRLRSSSRNRDHSGLVNSLVARSLPLISLPPLDKGLVQEGCGRRRARLKACHSLAATALPPAPQFPRRLPNIHTINIALSPGTSSKFKTGTPEPCDYISWRTHSPLSC